MLLPLREMRHTRKSLMDALQKRGIGTGISYEAIHLTRYFRAKGHREGEFPVSERIARETLTLPLFVEMADGDVDRVCEELRAAMREG